jgi:transcriptional regulator with XRE-family HTH domain
MSDARADGELDAVNVRLGEHLRRLRRQKGLSLPDVQALSEGEFKASVMGAYERGERAISAVRLAKLATLYRLPLQAMLPAVDAGEAATSPGGLALDVARIEAATGTEAKTLARFVKRLQAQRHEWTAGVVRIRAEDVVAIALACDHTPAELMKLVDEQGLRAY